MQLNWKGFLLWLVFFVGLQQDPGARQLADVHQLVGSHFAVHSLYPSFFPNKSHSVCFGSCFPYLPPSGQYWQCEGRLHSLGCLAQSVDNTNAINKSEEALHFKLALTSHKNLKFQHEFPNEKRVVGIHGNHLTCLVKLPPKFIVPDPALLV